MKIINYLWIQRFKQLIQLFHFDLARDNFFVLNIKKFMFHLAAKFLCAGKSSYFGDGRNNVAFIIAKIDFESR